MLGHKKSNEKVIGDYNISSSQIVTRVGKKNYVSKGGNVLFCNLMDPNP